MADNVLETIDAVNELSNGSESDLLEACQILHRLRYSNTYWFYGAETEVLPFFVKLISSENQKLQLEGAQFVNDMTSDLPYYKEENISLTLAAGAAPKLVKLLASSNHSILERSLSCLVDIAAYFPNEVLENGVLPPLVQCLNSNDLSIAGNAARCLKSVSNERQCITDIIDAESIEPLIRLLDSKDVDLFADVLYTLINIASYDAQSCQHILNVGALRYLKIFLSLTIKRADTRANSKTQLPAVIFIENVTSFNRAQIDMVVDENIIPLILQLINNAANSEIENHCIKIIQNIIKLKPDFISCLINDDDIISVLCNKLKMTKNSVLMEMVLSALVDLIKLDEYKEIIRQKIIDSDALPKLQILLEHEDDEVQELSNMINTFVNNDVELPPPERNDEGDIGESNDEDDECLFVEEILHNQRKRPLNAAIKSEGPDNKRFRVSMEQTNDEIPESFADEKLYGNDFDVADSVNPASLDSSIVTAVNATTLNAGLNSLGSSDNATADETIRSNFKIETTQHSQLDDTIPSTSVQPGLPEGTAAATMTPSDSNTVTEVYATASNNDEIFHSSGDSENATADETLRSCFKNEITEDSQHENMDVVSIPTTSFEPDDPEGTTAAFENSSTIPIVVVLPNEFTTLEYFYPPESFLKECCEKKLELKFDRKKYLRFLSTINFDSVNANSKPSECLPTNDVSGFECISMLFTFNTQNTEIIRMKINKQFNIYALQEEFDGDKIAQVVGRPYILKSEHLETIARWFNCRIMVYCNEEWKKYGDWNFEEENVPTVVLEKKQIKNDLIYQVVLSLKND